MQESTPARTRRGNVAFAVLTMLAFGLQGAFDEGSVGQLVSLGVALLVVGVWFAWGVRQSRQALGGPEQVGLFRRALQEGEVPAGADRDAWRDILAKQQRSMARMRIVNLVVVVALAAIALLAMVWLTSTVGITLAGALPLVLVGAFAAASMGLAVRSFRRQRHRIDVLLEQL